MANEDEKKGCLGWLFGLFSGETPRTGDSAAIALTWSRKTLLTAAELSFFHVLTIATEGRCLIFAKVRLGDLFLVKKGQGHWATLNKINRKHVDFVLCDPATTAFMGAIELDDRSHEEEGRKKRDKFVEDLFAWNHLPLIRIPAARAYAPEKIRETLAGVLAR